MKIDKRVMDLLKANCKTFGWDINKIVCIAFATMHDHDCDRAKREWDDLLDSFVEEEGKK